MQGRPDERVTFGDYAFDPSSELLFKCGSVVRVPDQSLRVLAALLESPGNLITREELARRIWPDGTHVEFEQGLNSVVKRLRAVLLDSSTAPRYIETFPKRGYRFVYPVQYGNSASGELDVLPPNALPETTLVSVREDSGFYKSKTAYALAAAVGLLLILICAAIVYKRGTGGRSNILAEAVFKTRSLAAKGNYGSAYDTAAAAASRLPSNDPGLEQLWSIGSRGIAVESSPVDADVFWQPYSDRKSHWSFLGKTPLRGGRVPGAAVRLRLEKPGYTTVEIAAPDSRYQLRMEKDGTQPGMVRIPAGPVFAQYAGVGKLGPVTLNEFWMDTTEVTNSEYQRFVAAGGYEKPEYWKFRVSENGRTLTWNEAMAKFIDQTGFRSPAGWSARCYPTGEGDYPVVGVSWYEAAAYAAFEKKSLPTVYQWFRAAHTDDSAFMLPLSNVGDRGPLPVKRQGAVGSFGVYDMAGNVREWCANESAGMRFILGGAWSDPSYMFVSGQKLPALNRSLTNGFRCVRAAEPGKMQTQLAAPIPNAVSERVPDEPVSNEVFENSKALYARDRTDLHAMVQSVTDSDVWRREKVRFTTGYSTQEMVAYLFLPKQGRPPYQCVVFVPSADAFQASPGDDIRPIEGVLQSGKAMIYPVLWGTFDRFIPLPKDPANAGYPSPMFIREALAAWRKDLGRTLDYLQTRSDIGSIGYLGMSTGAEFAPVLLAEEERVKAAQNKTHVLVDSGHGVLAPEVRNKTLHEMLGWFDRFLATR